MYNDHELIQIQASTLYVMNKDNRIVRINEQTELQPPALFIGKTKNSSVIHFRDDIPQYLLDEIQTLPTDPLPIIDYCKIVEKHQKVKTIWAGPAYYFSTKETLEHLDETILIDDSNKALLRPYFNHLTSELSLREPVVAYVVNGEAVSVCCSARRSKQAAEASLMTAEPFRGKGYAAKVVSSWVQLILKSGLIPLYSTSWDNIASQQVAKKLGFVQYGVDFNISTE
ncbi:GNAT family N-acetyltransferase [Paenibacillus radicibacter]|uniref:GNAT family N-acetyltransferase n=1 Tax=Paenibacillus radicibacter TaxID=2972488 RepID=UPI00215909F4|nr:GNAT family N-acetyltransferase [Paenibacillus radicibacter]